MNLVKAWKALLDENCVVNKSTETIYKLENDELKTWQEGLLDDGGWRHAEGNGLSEHHGPFKIIPDPSIPHPKNLTLEEAYKHLQANPDNGVVTIKTPFMEKEIYGTPIEGEIALMAVAEIKEWPMLSRIH